MYDPHVKYHVTSTKVNGTAGTGGGEPRTLSQLLEMLSARQVTGNAAVQTIHSFLVANDLEAPETETGDGLTLKEVFLRVLDRNLKAGVAGKTVRAVQWDVANGTGNAKNIWTVETPPSTPLVEPSLPPPTRLPRFSCALGKTVLRKDLGRVLSLPTAGGPKWLASRKLDGVRLLVVLDVVVPTSGAGGRVTDAWTLSRSGKEYTSLDVLKRQLGETLSDWPGLVSLVAEERGVPTQEGTIHRLVLDGELCHLADTPGPEPAEDFTQVVSMVRRKEYTIPRPAMFLLDVIPWSVFLDGMDRPAGKVFAQRVGDCQALVERVETVCRERGVPSVLRPLEQRVVGTLEEVEEMIGVAAERGWEGLVIRRADVSYEGKRRYVSFRFRVCGADASAAPIYSSTRNGRMGNTSSSGWKSRRCGCLLVGCLPSGKHWQTSGLNIKVRPVHSTQSTTDDDSRNKG